MSFVIPIKPLAADPDVIIDAARAQLLATPAVTAITTGVYSEVAPELAPGAPHLPYVVLALPSVVYASAYNDPTINVLLDVSVYSEGNSTTTVRNLMTACLSALLDNPWQAAGLTMIAVTMEMAGGGMRQVTVVVGGVITRGRQATIRILVVKP